MAAEKEKPLLSVKERKLLVASEFDGLLRPVTPHCFPTTTTPAALRCD